MFWLIYYDGVGVPDTEAAFSTAEQLCCYVDRFIHCSAVVSHYTVLCPNIVAVSLSKFYHDYKEI